MPHESLGGMSPDEVTLGFAAPMHFDWAERTTDWEGISRQEKMNRLQAQERVERLRGYHAAAKRRVIAAQEVMRTQANRRRREPDFGRQARLYFHAESL
jgi:hypothetical protein